MDSLNPGLAGCLYGVSQAGGPRGSAQLGQLPTQVRQTTSPYHVLIIKAKTFATMTHFGQIRNDLRPYITHCEAVAAALPEHLKALGWLHDVLEDGPPDTDEKLLQIFPPTIYRAVVSLTRREGQTHEQYMNALEATGDLDLFRVKIADMEHNLDGDPSPTAAARYRHYIPRFKALIENARC